MSAKVARPSLGRAAREGGFTLPELVVVMIVVGVLAAVAMPRLTDSGFDDRRLRDESIAALRYAQKAAIALRRTTCVNFPDDRTLIVQAETAFQAGNCATAANPLIGPDRNPLVVAAARNSRFVAFPGPGDWITFDPLGRPGGAAPVSVSNLPPALAITIEAETGYVH